MPEWDVDMHGVKRVTRNWRGKGNNEYETGDSRRKNRTANRTANHKQKTAEEHTSTWIFSLGIDRDMVLGEVGGSRRNRRGREARPDSAAMGRFTGGERFPLRRVGHASLPVPLRWCCPDEMERNRKEVEKKCIFYLPCHVSCLASLCPQSCPSSVCPVQPDRKLSYPNSAASPAPPASAPQTPAGTPPCSTPAGRSPSGTPASRHPVCAPRTSPPCLPRQMT